MFEMLVNKIKKVIKLVAVGRLLLTGNMKPCLGLPVKPFSQQRKKRTVADF